MVAAAVVCLTFEIIAVIIALTAKILKPIAESQYSVSEFEYCDPLQQPATNRNGGVGRTQDVGRVLAVGFNILPVGDDMALYDATDLPNEFEYVIPAGSGEKYFMRRLTEDEESGSAYKRLARTYTNTDGSFSKSFWLESAVLQKLNSGEWVIPADSVCNGVDANNNPLNFTYADLQPMYRFKTANNGRFICVPRNKYQSVPGTLIGVNSSGDWIEFRDQDHSEKEWRPVAVYAAPNGSEEMFDPNKVGDLIWKVANQAPKKKISDEKNTALDVLANHIEEFRVQIDELTAKHAEMVFALNNLKSAS